MKTKNLVLTIAVNVLLAGVVLGLFELTLSLKSPKRKLPVNGMIRGQLYTWGHRVVNNGYGFRERRFPEEKAAGVVRIMVLGDSLTWGAGLSEGERYSGVLERLLNGRNGPLRYEVLNFGVPGGPTTLERDILVKYAGAVKPDLVVVGFCVNDPQPKPQDHSVERDAFNGRYGRSIGLLSGALRGAGLEYTGETMEKAIYAFAERRGAFPNWMTALRRSYEKDSSDWKEFEKALRDIRATCDANRLPPPILAILNQGTFPDKPTRYDPPDEIIRVYLPWYHQAEDAGRRAGFRTINYEREIVEQLPGRILTLNVLDGHPTAELNALYAAKLCRVIADEYETRFPAPPAPSGRRVARRS